jgi:hypothetical protein
MVLVGRPKDKRLLRRPRRSWENSIKMDLREMGIDVAQDMVHWWAFVNTVMNLQGP